MPASSYNRTMGTCRIRRALLRLCDSLGNSHCNSAAYVYSGPNGDAQLYAHGNAEAKANTPASALSGKGE